MKKKILMYAALAAATTFTYGCNKSEENNQVVVSGITITSKNNVREIKVDETLQLTATVYPKGASQEIAWTSNDETKASVDGKGLVTALNDGMVSIKATSVVAPSISQVFSLVIKEKDVVVVNPTSVSIQSEGNVTALKAGEKLVLTATVYPSDASQNVEWSSSDETIATVKRGEVTGLKEGNVTIKATAKDKSDIFGTIQLEVTKSDDPIITKDWAAMSYTTHEAFMASENETPTKIKGIVTYVIPSADTNVSYYIQNGVDGYYIYQQNKSTFPVELGKCYEVGGFKKYYNGLNEIINVEYFKELNKNLNLPIEKQLLLQRQLATKMNIILLSDVLYKKEEWDKFDKWYNEDYLHRKVEILNIWESTYDDMRCNANLYQNNKLIANIIININECDVMSVVGTNSNIDYNKVFKSIIYSKFKEYSELPKISKCSKLLQKVYDEVCNSDNEMCYVTNDDWKELFSNQFDRKDIEKLKEEVKKLKIDNVITFNDGEYKILGWGNLALCFNDNRDFNKSKNKDKER